MCRACTIDGRTSRHHHAGMSPEGLKRWREYRKKNPWAWNLGLTKETDERVAANGRAISRAVTGVPKKPSEARRRHVAKQHENNVFKRWPTNLELALRRMLSEAGFDFDEQYRIGHYVVDAFDHDTGIAWEANGEPWHTWNEERKPGYYQRRSEYLKRSGVTAIIDLTQEDLCPWITR